MNASPMDLQCLAAKRFCIQLLREWATGDFPVIDKWKCEADFACCPKHDWFIWQVYEMPIPRSIVMPNLLRNQIEDNIALIVAEVRIWIRVHHAMGFFHDEPSSSLSEYLLKLVWTKDFTVDYTATARNTLTSSNLTAMEKFRFVSTYCFVDEMANFREVADTAIKQDLLVDSFVVYWGKYLKNELRTLSLPVENMSVDEFMLDKAVLQYQLWPPAQYFFAKLQPTKRFGHINHIIDLCGKRDRKDLLAILTDKKWNQACRNSIVKITKIFIESGTLEEMRYIWTHFKDTMCAKNFHDIMDVLVPLSMTNPSNFNAWTPFLMEIWSSAKKELKQSALEMSLWRSIGEKVVFHIIDEDPPDFQSRRRIAEPMKFIRSVLAYADANQRAVFLRENFFWLIIWQPLVRTKELLNEFLVPYSKNILKLKKEMKDSSEMHRSLYALLGYGEFDEFETLIRFCSSGKNDSISVSHETVFRFKCILLVPMPGLEALSNCLYFVDWRRVFEFVKNTFQNIVDIPHDAYMITLIEMGSYGGKLNLEDKFSKGEMKDIQECLSTILSSTDARLVPLKKRFKASLFKCLFDLTWHEPVVFKRVDVQNFLMWIFNGNEKSVKKNFKQPQLFPKGLMVQLKGCIDVHAFKANDSIEEYLQWCFPVEEQIRSFKREIIYKYREYELIEFWLKKRKYRRSVLNWFFDNDAGLIEKFVDEFATAK